jgi:chromosome segregation ATPase
MPQWLTVREAAVKAEEAALARVQRYREELAERLRHLEARRAVLTATGGAGAELLAAQAYQERLDREIGAVQERIRQADAVLHRQQERVARAQQALEVAQDVVREHVVAARRDAERRQDQWVSDVAGWRRPS